jgi:hypothetical protein
LGRTESGLCRLKKNKVLLVDSRLGAVDRCRVLIAEFRQLDIGSVYMSPLMRRRLADPESDYDR